MLGSSAGGYAALLFGRLLEADEVHAFGPQTFISPSLRLRYSDNWWSYTQKLWMRVKRKAAYLPG